MEPYTSSGILLLVAVTKIVLFNLINKWYKWLLFGISTVLFLYSFLKKGTLTVLRKVYISLFLISVFIVLLDLYRSGPGFHVIVDTLLALILLASFKVISFVIPDFLNERIDSVIYNPKEKAGTDCLPLDLDPEVPFLEKIKIYFQYLKGCSSTIGSLSVAFRKVFYKDILFVPKVYNPLNFLQCWIIPLIIILITIYTFWPSLQGLVAVKMYSIPTTPISNNFYLLPMIFGIILVFAIVRFFSWFFANELYWGGNVNDSETNDQLLLFQMNSFTYKNAFEYAVTVIFITYIIIFGIQKLLVFDISLENTFLLCFVAFLCIICIVLLISYFAKMFIVNSKTFHKILLKFGEVEQLLHISNEPTIDHSAFMPNELPMPKHFGHKQIVKKVFTQKEPRYFNYITFPPEYVENCVYSLQKSLVNESTTFLQAMSPSNGLVPYVQIGTFLKNRYCMYLLPISCAMMFAYAFTKINRSLNPTKKYDDRDMLIETFLIFFIGFLAIFFLLDNFGFFEKEFFGWTYKTLITITLGIGLLPIIALAIYGKKC